MRLIPEENLVGTIVRADDGSSTADTNRPSPPSYRDWSALDAYFSTKHSRGVYTYTRIRGIATMMMDYLGAHNRND